MFKCTVLIILTLIACISSKSHKCRKKYRDDEDLVVTLSHGGQVQGKQQTFMLIHEFFSFQGIPYAKPPTGELRLRNPRPHSGWTGIRDATKESSVCIGHGYIFGISGSEDCLFLNVYVPPNLSPKQKYAVMVWIHPGSFASGSSAQWVYGPERLVHEGQVITVTFNYRIGLLGFFSTNDKFAQGNYGLKDCVEALKWVQNNIEAFGGDRNQVTIFGESAGASLVHYLVLSPMAKGLFHRAISQSGTAINPWSFENDPKTEAFEFGIKLELQFNTTEQLVKEIRAVKDPETFALKTPELKETKIPRGNRPLPFAPTIEPEDSEEPRFLTQTPLSIMKSGNFNHVPYICGCTNKEALYVIYEQDRVTSNLLEILSQNPNMLLPYEWYIDPTSEAANEILLNIQNMYFNGSTDIEDIMQYEKYATDRHFEYAAYKTVELHSQGQTEPVYYYIFSFDGNFNFIKKILFLSGYDGAVHADDLGYLFQMFIVPLPSLGTTSGEVRTRMVKMWTNFAKYGNPTPNIDSVTNVNWTPLQQNHGYMNISDALSMEKEPFAERMAMWKELDTKYSNAK